MTSASFEVVPEDLLAHASHLAGLVDRLNTASAATASAMSDDAYGLLCAFLPPILNPTGEQAAATVKAAGDAIATSADNVRTAATSYQDNEDGSAQPFLRHISQLQEK
jgi:Excreted virulence factor EspC, type VII ESX diderm